MSEPWLIGVDATHAGAVLVTVDPLRGMVDQRRVLQAPTAALLDEAVAVLRQRAREPIGAVGVAAGDLRGGTQVGTTHAVFGAGACLALAEHRFGSLQGDRDAAVLGVRRELFAGLLWQGDVPGRGQRDPEAAHLPVDFDGLPCACGAVGCLETILSPSALQRAAQAARMPLRTQPRSLGACAEHEDLAGRSGRGDGRAQWMAFGVAQSVARALATLCRAGGVRTAALHWPGLTDGAPLALAIDAHLRQLLPGSQPLRVAAPLPTSVAVGAALAARAWALGGRPPASAPQPTAGRR